jgi:hypothetical protein
MSTFSPRWDIGDIIIHDRDGDGKITSDDKKIIGNQIPRFCYGLNMGFDCKNFDFSCFFQGVGKADGYIIRELYNIRKDNYLETFNPADPNPDAYFPRLAGPGNIFNYNYQYMSHWVENAAYLRLKNMQVGYSLSFPKYGIERCRFTLSGENLLTLTKFRNWDPETSVGASNSFPQVAIYSLGVNITF